MTVTIPDATQRMLSELSPLIEQHLAAAQSRLTPEVVTVLDPDLAAAAKRVADAVCKLDAAKFTRREIHARLGLERSARALRDVLSAFGKRRIENKP